MSQHKEFEALGPPNGLSPAQLKDVLINRQIQVLDLSGYELSKDRDQLVDVAIQSNIRWLMFSGVNFNPEWIDVNWTRSNSTFRGVIGRGHIGVVDHEIDNK